MAGARKSANAEGVRRITAIFVKRPHGGGSCFKYYREPFNLVEYDWGNGERTTGLEVVLGQRFRSRAGEPSECYDDIKVVEPSELSNWPRLHRTDKYVR